MKKKNPPKKKKNSQVASLTNSSNPTNNNLYPNLMRQSCSLLPDSSEGNPSFLLLPLPEPKNTTRLLHLHL